MNCKLPAGPCDCRPKKCLRRPAFLSLDGPKAHGRTVLSICLSQSVPSCSSQDFFLWRSFLISCKGILIRFEAHFNLAYDIISALKYVCSIAHLNKGKILFPNSKYRCVWTRLSLFDQPQYLKSTYNLGFRPIEVVYWSMVHLGNKDHWNLTRVADEGTGMRMLNKHEPAPSWSLQSRKHPRGSTQKRDSSQRGYKVLPSQLVIMHRVFSIHF